MTHQRGPIALANCNLWFEHSLITCSMTMAKETHQQQATFPTGSPFLFLSLPAQSLKSPLHRPFLFSPFIFPFFLSWVSFYFLSLPLLHGPERKASTSAAATTALSRQELAASLQRMVCLMPLPFLLVL